jgi:hypothetical protein
MLGLVRRADDYLKAKRQRHERRARQKFREITGGAEDWLSQEDFLRAKARGIYGIPDARCFTLQGVIRGLRHVDGDVAECGARSGKSTAFMLEADPVTRQYHIFDSFQGLSEPAAEDTTAPSLPSHWKRGDMAVNESETRANLADFANVSFYPGWIPERFVEVADRRFALLHVDVDLYHPTRDSLEFFWPRLMPGGMVVCDDYGFATCPGAKQALDEFFTKRAAAIIELSTGQALVTKTKDDP